MTMVKDPPKPKPKKTDPELLIKNWVGKVDNLDQIRIINVYDNRYRVDVFTRRVSKDALYHQTRIEKSFFLAVDNDRVVDLTWRKHEKAS